MPHIHPRCQFQHADLLGKLGAEPVLGCSRFFGGVPLVHTILVARTIEHHPEKGFLVTTQVLGGCEFQGGLKDVLQPVDDGQVHSVPMVASIDGGLVDSPTVTIQGRQRDRGFGGPDDDRLIVHFSFQQVQIDVDQKTQVVHGIVGHPSKDDVAASNVLRVPDVYLHLADHQVTAKSNAG